MSDKQRLQQSKEEMELAALMRAAQLGDSMSYRDLLIRVQTLIQAFVGHSLVRLALPSQDSKDVVQEVLLAVHSKRHTYDGRRFFLPWMYAIARHKIVDHFRRSRLIKKTVSIDDEIDSLMAISGLENGFQHDFDSLMNYLTKKQSEIIRLIKIDGLSVEETSHRTGYSRSDVKVTVHRAIKSLQDKVRNG